MKSKNLSKIAGFAVLSIACLIPIGAMNYYHGTWAAIDIRGGYSFVVSFSTLALLVIVGVVGVWLINLKKFE